MIKKNFSLFIIKNRSNGKIRYNRIRHPRNHSPMVREKDGMALEKEKQEINNVKYIKGNQDAQKSFLIIFCEAEVLLRGIGETGTG